MITGDIITAIQAEVQALASDAGEGFIGQVILRTDFKDTGEISYSMPLVMIEIEEGPDTVQFLGGATRLDLNIFFDVFNYDPNAYGDDTTGYSGSLKDVIDQVRQHFSLRGWLTPNMPDVETNYGLRLTLAGVHKASALKYKDGLCKGFRITFDSVAIDDGTDSVVLSTSTLKTIAQVDP